MQQAFEQIMVCCFWMISYPQMKSFWDLNWLIHLFFVKSWAIANTRQTDLFPCFVFCSHHKHPKYLERQLNPGYCLRHHFFMNFAIVIILFWLRLWKEFESFEHLLFYCWCRESFWRAHTSWLRKQNIFVETVTLITILFGEFSESKDNIIPHHPILMDKFWHNRCVLLILQLMYT